MNVWKSRKPSFFNQKVSCEATGSPGFSSPKESHKALLTPSLLRPAQIRFHIPTLHTRTQTHTHTLRHSDISDLRVFHLTGNIYAVSQVQRDFLPFSSSKMWRTNPLLTEQTPPHPPPPHQTLPPSTLHANVAHISENQPRAARTPSCEEDAVPSGEAPLPPSLPPSQHARHVTVAASHHSVCDSNMPPFQSRWSKIAATVNILFISFFLRDLQATRRLP